MNDISKIETSNVPPMSSDTTLAGPRRIEIERVSGQPLSVFHERYLNAAQPVIFTGAMSDWEAVTTWTPDYFKDHYGDVQVRVTADLPDTAVPSDYFWEEHIRRMNVSDFVDLMKSAERPCMIDSRSLEFFPGTMQQVHFEKFLPKLEGNEMTMTWIGSKGTHSGLHFDRFDNLFGQVYGEKVVCLLAPDQSRYLYQFADLCQKSNVDPEAPDLDKYPDFAKATVMQAVLRPGDVLFIPKVWWHSLRSTSSSISSNFWFGKDAGLSELLPLAKAGGARVMGRMARDFVWHGLLGRRFERRLLSEEPNGVWLYQIVRDAVGRRLGRSASGE
ncbi:MAG: cupin-like domain-containing protein [Rhodospirillales bacterium]|nr:cupin-like domain-containing protein [Rhodospirillales bacterium]